MFISSAVPIHALGARRFEFRHSYIWLWHDIAVRSIPSSVDNFLFVWLGGVLASAKAPDPRAPSAANSCARGG